MKRIAAMLTMITLLCNIITAGVYADTPVPDALVQKKVMLYLKPDVTVELNGSRQIFRDLNGQSVFPIIYNGTTYLPVRAVSAIMKEPIEWDGKSKTVFVGKTLTYPNKDKAPISTGAAVSADDNTVWEGPSPSIVSGYIKPDVLVMFDFVVQSFQDVNGRTVYPIIYNGSTYLPVRAISQLMGEPITWDGTLQKICIGNGKEEEEESEELPPEEEISNAYMMLQELYDKEESLYYEATAKISSIKDAASTEEKQLIATSASENYQRAQSLTMEVKEIDQTDFTDEEIAVCEKLTEFTESTEYYILVLENIAYMAASDSDYSMLAETFLYFALESKTKMEETQELLETLIENE